MLAVALECDAAIFNVTNTNDSGAGSLRQAVADANATAAADTINFDTAGVFSTARTITLTSGEIEIIYPRHDQRTERNRADGHDLGQQQQPDLSDR